LGQAGISDLLKEPIQRQYRQNPVGINDGCQLVSGHHFLQFGSSLFYQQRRGSRRTLSGFDQLVRDSQKEDSSYRRKTLYF